MRETILHTIHGSHLYGLAHANSDTDSYSIFIGNPEGSPNENGMDTAATKKFAKQTFDQDGNDILKMHLSRFLENAREGSPQALEALFSPYAEFDPRYEAFFQGLRPSMELARARYRRTIINFAFHHGGRSATRAQREQKNEKERYKLARHSLRLTLNLNDLMRYGYFNPSLSEEQAEYISELAQCHEYDGFAEALERMLEDAQLGRMNI